MLGLLPAITADGRCPPARASDYVGARYSCYYSSHARACCIAGQPYHLIWRRQSWPMVQFKVLSPSVRARISVDGCVLKLPATSPASECECLSRILSRCSDAIGKQTVSRRATTRASIGPQLEVQAAAGDYKFLARGYCVKGEAASVANTRRSDRCSDICWPPS